MDDHGAPINQAFSVSVSEGGAEEGSVADMQIHTAMTQKDGSYTPDFSHADTTAAVNISQSSSISRTGIGRYTFTRERLPGTGAESFVVDAVHRYPTVPDTVCHIVSAGPTGSGNALEQINVACDTFTHAGNSIPADPIGVAVSYSRDASLIGLKNAASDGHARVPLITSSSEFKLTGMRNRMYGNESGAGSVIRQSAGVYKVKLEGQASGVGIIGVPFVTAENSSPVTCRPTDQWFTASQTTAGAMDAQLVVSCLNSSGTPVDSAFDLQFMLRQ
ncbi:hypothetical protein [Streptomyces sp. NPDC002952]|uniref:hypothetical protein n=1 Tax=Streptomyces sp. NPDC002952 TaxID=3364673 RepID=UPI003680FE77